MNTQTNRTLTAALTLALAVGLTACSTSEDEGVGVAPESPTAVETTDETTEATTDDTTDDDADDTTGTADDTAAGTASGDDRTASALEAIATAEAEVDGTAYEIDDQDEDGTWEVDLAVDNESIEVSVFEDGRTVVETEADDLEDEDRAGLAAATITLQDAIETAAAEVGGTLDDAELEEEDGRHFWEVTIDENNEGDEAEVLVDVTNGEVIRVED